METAYTGSPELTPQQTIFADTYALGNNGQAAAEVAGYSKKHARKQASKLLKLPAVRERIEEVNRQREVEGAYDAKRWREDLLEDICEAKMSGSHSAVMKGRELLGRHIGALKDSGRMGVDEALGFAWLGAAAARAGWGVEGNQGSPATRRAAVTIDAAGHAAVEDRTGTSRQ